MDNLIENLKNLGTGKLVALGSMFLALLLGIFFTFTLITKPVFNPLYSGLEPGDSASITSALESAGIQVQISPDGSVISIPRESFASARMLLAQEGLPSKGNVGWELFDDAGSLGMTSFMQKVTKLRAMEGELARSIETIKGIDAARVHLVLPDREVFSREKVDPSASVVVRTSGSYSVEKNQALAIRHLISSAVPDLHPSKVTVLSAAGEIILAEEQTEITSEASMQGVKASIEDRYSIAIDKILSARVGAGNARVNVTVDLNGNREVVREESFDPNQQVVRSTETSEEEEASDETGQNVVSVNNNIPNAQENGGPSQSNRRNKIDEIVNYEIGKTTREIITEPGQIEKISVAVLVNGIFSRNDEGEVVYEERDDAEIQRLEQLVKSAIGFDEARGDVVSVDSLRFMDYSMELGDPNEVSITDILAENIMSIMQWMSAIILTLLILLLGVRPIIANVFPQIEEEEDEFDDEDFEDDDDDDTIIPMEDEEEELITISSIQGGIRAKRLQAVEDVVDQAQDETLKVLRSWIAPDTL